MVSVPHIQALPSEQRLVTAPHQSGPVAQSPPSSRSLIPGIVSISLGIFSFVGIAFALWLRTVPAGNPDPRFFFNAFYVLFARNEVTGLTIVALFNLLATVFFFRKRRTDKNDANSSTFPAWLCGSVALFVVAITTVGSQVVFHNYLLASDENLADFQARIFLRGKIQAEVPPQWVPAARVLRATFVDYFPETHRWNATYLPVYAAMRAAFQSVDLQILLNPVLSAIALFALYGTVRNLWPESKSNAAIAVLLLAASSQFLLMSMTGYSMSAHLALNAIWLWLYSRPEKRRFYLAPIVGALALGLHQPVFHALFALPFLFRLVRQRRWLHTIIFAAIYLVACACWYWWKMHFAVAPLVSHNQSVFRLLSPNMAIIQPMDLLLVIAWASLATPLLAFIGFTSFFRQRPIMQDAILSCVLTFGFYYFFRFDQGHGWGYRYFHGVLPCFVLMAIAGWERLSILIGERRTRGFVLAGVAVSILVQLPLRCFQAETFVRPYARAAAVIHSMPQNIVGINPLDAWYVADLIRNDPFLETRPVIAALYGLVPSEVAPLEANGSARFITPDQLAQLGLFTAKRDNYRHDPFRLGSGK